MVLCSRLHSFPPVLSCYCFFLPVATKTITFRNGTSHPRCHQLLEVTSSHYPHIQYDCISLDVFIPTGKVLRIPRQCGPMFYYGSIHGDTAYVVFHWLYVTRLPYYISSYCVVLLTWYNSDIYKGCETRSSLLGDHGWENRRFSASSCRCSRHEEQCYIMFVLAVYRCWLSILIFSGTRPHRCQLH